MQKLSIIKIGGALIEDDAQLDQVVNQFSAIKHPKILVHGGGKTASQMCRHLGIEPKMSNGRRITDKAALDVTTMVYAGLLNKKIVSLLQKKRCNAMGFTGADGNLITAKKRPPKGIDYGYVGDIEVINTPSILQLIHTGIVPIFCAITHNQKGQLLNTNADVIAAELAKALSKYYKVTLKFCFDKSGVLEDPEREDSVIPIMSEQEYPGRKQSGMISAGMIPKLECAFAAKQGAVHQVIICGISGIQQINGTEICL